MLELCGSGYVIDHCMSAFRKYKHQIRFESYIANGLYAMVMGKGAYTMTYDELLHPKTEKEKAQEVKDNKEEAKRIQNSILNKLRGD